MDLVLLIQHVINGLLLGGVYALVAAGLTLIYGVMKIINFAHGEFVTAGMYVAYGLHTVAHLTPYVAAAVSLMLFVALGALLERGLVEPVLTAPQLNQILLTLGVSLFLANGMMVVFSPDTRTLQGALTAQTLTSGGITVSLPRVIAFGVAMALSVILYLLLQGTKWGRAIRAAAEDRQAAHLVGVDVRQVYKLTFGLGVALAAVAGTLITPFYSVHPFAGTPFVFTAFVIVVLGTMGHFMGALAGGLIVGVAESVGALVLSPALKQLVSFAIFVLILLFRPAGLFGRREG